MGWFDWLKSLGGGRRTAEPASPVAGGAREREGTGLGFMRGMMEEEVRERRAAWRNLGARLGEFDRDQRMAELERALPGANTGPEDAEVFVALAVGVLGSGAAEPLDLPPLGFFDYRKRLQERAELEEDLEGMTPAALERRVAEALENGRSRDTVLRTLARALVGIELLAAAGVLEPDESEAFRIRLWRRVAGRTPGG